MDVCDSFTLVPRRTIPHICNEYFAASTFNIQASSGNDNKVKKKKKKERDREKERNISFGR